MTEKRKQLRQMVNAPVKLSHSTFGEFTAVTGNISNSGAFINVDTNPPLPIGAEVKLQFLSSVYPDVIFNARIVLMIKTGYGLEFIDYEYEGNRLPMESFTKIWNNDE